VDTPLAGQWDAMRQGLLKEGVDDDEVTRIIRAAGKIKIPTGEVGKVPANIAIKLERQLQEQQRVHAINAAQSGDPKSKALSKAYKKAEMVIRKRLDNMQGSEDEILRAMTPERVGMLNDAIPGNEFIPPLGDKILSEARRGTVNLSSLRHTQAKYVQLLRAAYETERAPMMLKNSSNQLAARLAGAGIGLSAGNPLAVLIGYVAGPIVEPAVSGAGRALQVPAGTGAGTLLNRLSHGGWKLPLLGAKQRMAEFGARAWQNPYAITPAIRLGREALAPEPTVPPFDLGKALPTPQPLPQGRPTIPAERF